MVSPYSLTVPGGVQNQVLALARALGNKGHRVRVLAPCDGAPPATGITPLGASIPTDANGSIAPIAPDPACALRTIRALRDEAFDVVHLHEPICPGPCQTALWMRTAPMVGTWHAAGGSKAYNVPLTKWLAGRMAVRTAVSNDARDMAQEAIGGTYEVTFNGIEIERYAKADPFPTDVPTIAYVGRHEPRKGLAVLLEAMRWAPSWVRLWVMSEGPQTAELRRRFGHDERIEWLGSVSDEERIRRVRAADVACVPSLRGESFGIVLLEAMASKTAVVASDLPGYRNVAVNGDEAMLVPPGDPRALGRALRKVLDSPRRREELVAAGELRAGEFSMDLLAERYLDLYQQAIAAEHPRNLV